MAAEWGIGMGIVIGLLAFFLEYMDASLGMGYGTTLTPILLLIGFEPLQVVPAVLVSQLVAGITASFFHHRLENVNFRRGQRDLNIMLVLVFFGIGGVVPAVLIAVKIPALVLKVYIGALVLAIGVFMLVTINKHFTFSWKKIVALSLIASFNKGISGGGYGPLVTGGQILSGVDGKRAIGITTLSEVLITVAAVSSYLALKNATDWSLTPYLVVGAVLSTPFSAFTVRSIDARILRFGIGSLTSILGFLMLVKIFL